MSSNSDDDISADNNVNHAFWQNEDTVQVTPRNPSNLSTPSHSRNVRGFQKDFLTSTPMQNPNQSVYETFVGSSHFDNASYENIMGNQPPSYPIRRSSRSSLNRKGTTSRIDFADIVLALKTGKFNDQEIRHIKVALQNAIKSNERLHLVIRKKFPISKSIRRRYSRVQRNITFTRDDCRSLKDKCNKTTPGFVGQDINHWDDTIQNIDIYNIIADPSLKDCTDHIKQNTAKNKLTAISSIINSRDKVQSNEKYTDTQNYDSSSQNINTNNISVMNQKATFEKSYLYNSQRLNKSAGQSHFNDIYENNSDNSISSIKDTVTKTLLAQSHFHPIVEEDIIACVPSSQNWRIEKVNDKPIEMNITNACMKTNPFKCNFKFHSPIVEEDSIACVPNSQNWRIGKANDKTNPFKCNFKFHSPIVEEDSIACVQNSQNWRIGKANDKTNPFKCNFKFHSPIVEEDSIACVPNSQNWRIGKANDKPVEMNITYACRKTNPFKCIFNILSPIVEEEIITCVPYDQNWHIE